MLNYCIYYNRPESFVWVSFSHTFIKTLMQLKKCIKKSISYNFVDCLPLKLYF